MPELVERWAPYPAIGKHPFPSAATASIIITMTTPTTTVIKTFTERSEALAHCIQRAGEAPRLLAFDDTIGCPTAMMLAVLEQTRVIGLLLDEDSLFAGRLTSDTAAAVIERKHDGSTSWIYYGPRMETAAVEAMDGAVLLDQPGLSAIEFDDRAFALAHFLRATGGRGALLAQLGRRAPELRYLRRWFPSIMEGIHDGQQIISGWFAASSGGALFINDGLNQAPYCYIEVGIDP